MNHVENLQKRNSEPPKLYTVDVIVGDAKKSLPSGLNNAQQLLIKGAVIEDNRQIPNRSSGLPKFTVVFPEKFRTFDDPDGAYENNRVHISAINDSFNIELFKSKENALSSGGIASPKGERSNLVYSLSEQDVEKLMRYGVPKVTYSEDANRPLVYSNTNSSQIESGKPLGGIRLSAIKDALSQTGSVQFDSI